MKYKITDSDIEWERMTKRCRRCEYYGEITEHKGTCDYLLITGHSRSRICSGGKGCTVYTKKKTGARRASAERVSVGKVSVGKAGAGNG